MKEKALRIIAHPLFSGSALMIIGTNAVSGLNYVYHFVMGRLLGVAGYGELVALFSLVSLLGMIPAALSLVVAKFVSSANEKENIYSLIVYLQKKIVIMSVPIFLVCILFSGVAKDFLKLTTNLNFILVSLTLILAFPISVNRAVLQGLLRFRSYVTSLLLDNTFKLISGAALVLLGWSVFGALVALVLTGIFSTLLGFYLIRDYLYGSKFKPPKIKSLVIYSLPVFAHQLAITSFISSDLILVKHFFDPVQAGYYSGASTVGKIIFFAASPVMSVMFPLISKRISSGLQYKKIFYYSIALTLLITIIGALGFTFFAPFAVWLLFGKGFGLSSLYLPLFSLFMIFLSLNNLLIGFFLSANKTRITILPLIAALLQVVLIIFLHNDLYQVLAISVIVSALLSIILIVYSIYDGQVGFSNSSRLQTGKNNRQRPQKNP